MSQDHLAVLIDILKPINSLYRPCMVARHCAMGKDYCFDGAIRDCDKPHTIFQYTISGTGGIRYRDRVYPLPPGSAFFCNSHSPEVTYFYPPNASEPWHFYYANFINMEHIAADLNDRFGPVYELTANSVAIQRMKNLLFSGTTQHILSPSAGHDFASTILADILAGLDRQSPPTSTSTIIKNAVTFIYENLSEPLNVQILADQLQISREHLSRLFISELRQGPLEFINKARIRSACRLLQTTKLSIRQISESVGCENTSHFARLFRRITATCPSQFRKSNRIPVI